MDLLKVRCQSCRVCGDVRRRHACCHKRLRFAMLHLELVSDSTAYECCYLLADMGDRRRHRRRHGLAFIHGVVCLCTSWI